jgi:hypothetical protein
VAELPEKGSFWVGNHKLIVIEEVVEATDPRDTFGHVIVRPMDSTQTTRVPLDDRWGKGIVRAWQCPECEQPVPGPHLGTCRYSLMRTGPAALHTLPEGEEEPLIRRRSPEEMRAYREGFAAAIATIEEHDIAFAQDALKLMEASNG